MSRIYMILGSCILILILIRVYKRSYRPTEGFEGAGKELYIVKMEKCGHCVKAMPEFNKLVSASPVKLADGSSVAIRMLDSNKDKTMVDSLSVRGFPTILYMDGGKRMEYDGERTYDGVMGFLQGL